MKLGQPPIHGKRMETSMNIRVTAEQHRRLMELGGSKWVRARLDEQMQAALQPQTLEERLEVVPLVKLVVEAVLDAGELHVDTLAQRLPFPRDTLLRILHNASYREQIRCVRDGVYAAPEQRRRVSSVWELGAAA